MKQTLLLFITLGFAATSALFAQSPCASGETPDIRSNFNAFFNSNKGSVFTPTLGSTITLCLTKTSPTSNARTITIENVESQGEEILATYTVLSSPLPGGQFDGEVSAAASGFPIPLLRGSYGIEVTLNALGSFDVVTQRRNQPPVRFTVQIQAGSAAPVTWTKDLSYEAFGENVRFNWSVAEQVDVAGYELERMYEGGAFEKVADVAYQENGSLEVDYSSVVNWPAQSAYYRVKQLDYAGTFDYSNTVFVEGNDNLSQQFKMFPNPATDFVRMSVPEGIRSVDLISASGRLVRSYSAAEVSREGMDVSQVSAGLYLVRPLTADGPGKTQRLVVNH